MNISPITPDEAIRIKYAYIPPEVIDTINEMIVENVGRSATIFLQEKDIIDRCIINMRRNGKIVSLSNFFEHKWLDFSLLYETFGWGVYHHYSVSNRFEPYYAFSKK